MSARLWHIFRLMSLNDPCSPISSHLFKPPTLLYTSLIQQQRKYLHSALGDMSFSCIYSGLAGTPPFSLRPRKHAVGTFPAQFMKKSVILRPVLLSSYITNASKPCGSSNNPHLFYFSWKLQQISQPQYQKSNPTFEVDLQPVLYIGVLFQSSPSSLVFSSKSCRRWLPSIT